MAQATQTTDTLAGRKTVAALLSFFQWTAESFWGDGPSQIDGGDFQEKAEALGLIVEVPYDPAEHGEWGRDEYGLIAGDPWYVYSAPVRAALRLAKEGR